LTPCQPVPTLSSKLLLCATLHRCVLMCISVCLALCCCVPAVCCCVPAVFTCPTLCLAMCRCVPAAHVSLCVLLCVAVCLLSAHVPRCLLLCVAVCPAGFAVPIDAGPGASFFLIELLLGQPSSTTIRATCDCTLWVRGFFGYKGLGPGLGLGPESWAYDVGLYPAASLLQCWGPVCVE
jgi:hypothetical protein